MWLEGIAIMGVLIELGTIVDYSSKYLPFPETYSETYSAFDWFFVLEDHETVLFSEFAENHWQAWKTIL